MSLVKDVPVQTLEVCEYKQVHTHCEIINLHNLEYYTYLHLPETARGCRLFEIYSFLPYKEENCDELLSSVWKEPGKPWIRIDSDQLDKSVGMHVYKLSFVNLSTKDVFSLYFAYIIQNDDPEKPYIYMDRDTSTESEVS